MRRAARCGHFAVAGNRLTEFAIETNGHALVEAIRRIPGRKHRVFEEGIQSALLYETLGPHVGEIVAAGIPECRGPKSDRRDALVLAERLRTGALEKRIFKAPGEFNALRKPSRIPVPWSDTPTCGAPAALGRDPAPSCDAMPRSTHGTVELV